MPALRYRALLCDLLTALVDSWSLWAEVAADPDLGRRWREASLRLVTSSGRYRPYDAIVAEAARAVELDRPDQRAAELLARWPEIRPYPDVPPALQSAREAGLKLAVVTNTSQRLAEITATSLGVPIDAIVSAEAVGYYKPDPRPYRAGFEALEVPASEALFVAGSAHDVPGAAGAGLGVLWVNRRNLPLPPGSPEPIAIIPTLDGLLDLPHLRA